MRARALPRGGADLGVLMFETLVRKRSIKGGIKGARESAGSGQVNVTADSTSSQLASRACFLGGSSEHMRHGKRTFLRRSEQTRDAWGRLVVLQEGKAARGWWCLDNGLRWPFANAFQATQSSKPAPRRFKGHGLAQY